LHDPLSGFEVVDWSSFRTCRCTIVAPASNAAWVDSTCSVIVIGTAGLFSLRGSDPVIATMMMQGFTLRLCIGFILQWQLLLDKNLPGPPRGPQSKGFLAFLSLLQAPNRLLRNGETAERGVLTALG
jgi:hypothetical protein